MVRAPIREIELPDEAAIEQAAGAVKQLKGFLDGYPTTAPQVHLEGEGLTGVTLPAVALRPLVAVLDELANGDAVAVVPVHAELTSQQAADLLNVSRPYLIKLLDDERIPYRKVGNRRKIRLSHLLEYRRREEAGRREIADKLTREAERIGLEY